MVNGYKAASLQEALEIRSKYDVTPYAGGTDLMVKGRPGQTFLFLNKVPELKNITEDDEFIRIGAGVSFTQALADPKIPQIMKDAVSLIAAPAIRNAGTFGGNLGNGSAKADSVLIEYALGAKLRLMSLRGERIIDVDKFYLGEKKLDLAKDELITEILLPARGWEKYYYQKVGGRRALAISRVSFAGVFEEKDGRITNVAAAFGAVSETVLRYPELEEKLIGKTIAEARAMMEEYIDAYDKRLELRSGRVSAEYRKAVCLNLLREFLTRFIG